MVANHRGTRIKYMKCSYCYTTVSSTNSREECDNCERKRKRREEEEESDNRRRRNMLMGDILNTGIPGGFDSDMTTPW